MQSEFNYCRVCLRKNENNAFSSMFSNRGIMRKFFYEKFRISYHRYFYERDKVLICDSCVEKVKNANDCEVAELKSSILYFKQRFFDKYERKLFNYPEHFDLNQPSDYQFMYHHGLVDQVLNARKSQARIRTSRLKKRLQATAKSKVTIQKQKSRQKQTVLNKQIKNAVTTRKEKKAQSPLLCDASGKSFSSRSNRIRHERQSHVVPVSSERPQCKKCEKSFVDESTLTRHDHEVHLKVKPYRCNYCRKKFTRRANLAQHLKVCRPIYSYMLRRRSMIPRSYKFR